MSEDTPTETQQQSFLQRCSASLRNTGSGVRDFFSRRFHRDSIDEEANIRASVEGKAAEIRRVIVRRIERCRVSVIMGFVATGMLSLIIALVLPEWFILNQFGGSVKGHIGIFRRCIYGPLPNSVQCGHEIIAEVAASIALFLTSLVTGLASIICGIKRLAATSCRPSSDDADTSTYDRMRAFALISGLTCTSGVATFTYLYNNFVVPFHASYILGWLSCLILMTGGIIGYCFKREPLTRRSSSVSPMPQQGKTSWQHRSSLDNNGDSQDGPSIRVSAVASGH